MRVVNRFLSAITPALRQQSGVSILGRVLFSAKAEPLKAEPKLNWSEIESRLQQISAPARARDLSDEAALPIEPSSTLAHDPALLDEPSEPLESETRDQPVSTPADPLELLSMLAAIPSNRS